ncbi:Sirohydrochlorin ferrochelatase [Allochromatium warmingii]|uniref:Sirohydrochlorin ferrochelatase n=1 Tax=Allochromatium warmingii TaxID=61595 RepID=A0A1H3EIY6_ALLWA|nr:CbiX/SirB N-terminal domain-containing protein [Allochromatium warmingii]SDX78580.1 Sirohydrochlorin ferrochelatase [Allochromatium warmingii]
MPSRLLLVDNGSRRADSTRNLRRIAAQLAAQLGEPVLPVSLLHADRVPAAALDGQAAEILAVALRRLVQAGEREFNLIPVFFGRSRALTAFIPELVAQVQAELGPLRLDIAPELCPLPDGEPRLVEILADQLAAIPSVATQPLERVVLVDHGSPIPEVTAVRRWLARQLATRLGPTVQLYEAVMERRAGAEYDFNGPLLEALLTQLASEDAQTPIRVALLFLSAGRHAGPVGDLAQIGARIRAQFPTLPLHLAPLVGEHPRLIEILASRVQQVLRHAR